jgi:hypothetical protein
MKNYKSKSKKYKSKLDSENANFNFKLITEKDMYMSMAEALILSQMIKCKNNIKE